MGGRPPGADGPWPTARNLAGKSQADSRQTIHHSHRHQARASVVEALYQCDLMHDMPEQVGIEVLRRRPSNRAVTKFFRRLFERTIVERPQIDLVLSETLKKWKLARLSYLDRAILRMACCEILFFDDIPPAVTINEAVVLAKEYIDQKSALFVNGVLDAVARHHPKQAASSKQLGLGV